MDTCEACYNGGAIQRLELLEPRAVHHPPDHTPDVERLFGVRGDEPTQLLGGIERLFEGIWEGGGEGGEGEKGRAVERMSVQRGELLCGWVE